LMSNYPQPQKRPRKSITTKCYKPG
jgi:hypothetical protein